MPVNRKPGAAAPETERAVERREEEKA